MVKEEASVPWWQRDGEDWKAAPECLWPVYEKMQREIEIAVKRAFETGESIDDLLLGPKPKRSSTRR